MKQIKLTQGKFALVDDEDYEWLNQWKWHALRCSHLFYAIRTKTFNGKKYIFMMHREILKLNRTEILTDHRDRNGLNNQKLNLRIATHSENMTNRKSSINSTSKYLGVCYAKDRKKWMACIRTNGKRIYLGYFNIEKYAAKIYNKAALKYHGEFANLNII